MNAHQRPQEVFSMLLDDKKREEYASTTGATVLEDGVR